MGPIAMIPPARAISRRALRFVGQVSVMVLATACYIASIKLFIQPNHLLSGGVTGISLLLHTLVGLPVGLGVMILNVPIFLWGFRDVGRRFAIYSALGVVLFWLGADHVPLGPATTDPMLGAIFGGVVSGIGTALALKAGGSLGGLDILGVVFNRRFSMGVGEVGLLINSVLVLSTGILEKPELAMYTLVSIFAGGKTVDALYAPTPRKAVLIVSRESVTIRERIMAEMRRGVTVFKGEGAFTHEGIEVLFCVVTRYELQEMRELILREDPEAFVSVWQASDVYGRFNKQSALSYLKKLAAPPGQGRGE
jgi:uncharacterized membrane-anchored protein YitT (DUF2179 family)